MEVAVVTNGFLPVPPTKGGAVENITYNVVRENEKYHACRFTVFTIDDGETGSCEFTDFVRIKPSRAAVVLDRMAYFIVKDILHKADHSISYRYFFQRMEFMRKVGKKLRERSFDKVLLENNVTMFRALTYRDNLDRYRGKIYYHAHNELGMTLGYDRYLPQTKKIIAVSDYIKSYYENLLGPGGPKVETVHNVIDEKLFSKRLTPDERASVKRKFGVSLDHPVLLFAGRISPEKGIMELLEALGQLDRDDYDLLVAGRPFYETDLKTAFEEKLQRLAAKIRGHVVFTGYVPYERMYQCYQIADLCILPSVWNEPFALTVAECVMSGTPLITTRMGGIPETATEATILLETDHLADKLKEQIEKYLDDPDELRRLKEASEKCVFSHGTLEEYYNRFIRELDIDEEKE